MNRLIIVGVDPGTTLGYAILDINGNILNVGSSRVLDLNSLISLVILYGRVVVVGADKNKVSHLVLDFASKFNAKVIKPKIDMSIDKKRELTAGFKLENDHERDALAGALFAYKKTRNLFVKVDRRLEKKDKDYLADDVKEQILKKNLSVADSLELLEGKEDRIIKKKRNKTRSGIIVKKNEFALLKEKYDQLVKEVFVLRKERRNLLNKQSNEIDVKLDRLLRFKDERINYLDNAVKNYENEIKYLQDKSEKLKFYFSKGIYIFIDKLPNLNFETVKNEKLGKIIFVEHVGTISEKMLYYLNKTRIIIFRNGNPKGDFIFINCKDIDFIEEDNYVLVRKEDLDRAVNNVDILHKVIREYKEERKTSIER